MHNFHRNYFFLRLFSPNAPTLQSFMVGKEKNDDEGATDRH
jgi:hypothetical protein